MSSAPKIVITGMGLFTPFGCEHDKIKQRVLSNESAIRPVERFVGVPTPGQIGAELLEYDEKEVKKTLLKPVRRSIKVMCREIEFGVAAAAAALDDSEVLGKVAPERLGIDYGANLMVTPPPEFEEPGRACLDDAGIFDFGRWGEHGFPRMEPLWLLKYLPNMPACHICILADARGPNNSLTQDEASMNLVIGEAIRVIERGWADAMITGTTGTRIDEMKSIHAAMWDVLGLDPDNISESCRPFDRDRNGQVVGEGSGVFILETAEHATARGAKVLATILGTGAASGTTEDGKPDYRAAMARAMKQAIKAAGLTPDDIGHVNAHGLGTVETDAGEAAAIHDVFGDRGATIPVTALKSRVGNAGASCGAIELGLSILAAQEGLIPVTLGFKAADPGVELNIVTGEPLPLPNKIMISVNVTRLGQASAVVVEFP